MLRPGSGGAAVRDGLDKAPRHLPARPFSCRLPVTLSCYARHESNPRSAGCSRVPRLSATESRFGSSGEIRTLTGRVLNPLSLPLDYRANNSFEPAFRVDRGRVATTNWGLFVSRSIVSEHGGRLEIASELGKGTVATLTLPDMMANSAQKTSGPSMKPAASGRSNQK